MTDENQTADPSWATEEAAKWPRELLIALEREADLEWGYDWESLDGIARALNAIERICPEAAAALRRIDLQRSCASRTRSQKREVMTDTPNQTAPTPNEIRGYADMFRDYPEVRRCLDGAAAEIERLRAENAILKNDIGWWRDGVKKHGGKGE